MSAAYEIAYISTLYYTYVTRIVGFVPSDHSWPNWQAGFRAFLYRFCSAFCKFSDAKGTNILPIGLKLNTQIQHIVTQLFWPFGGL